MITSLCLVAYIPEELVVSIYNNNITILLLVLRDGGTKNNI